MPEREHIQIYTRAWRDDAPISSDNPEDPNAYLSCRVFLDGKELHGTLGAKINTAAGDFLTVTLELGPSKVELIPLREDEWEALGK